MLKLKRRRVANKFQEEQAQPAVVLAKLCGLALPDGVWFESTRGGGRVMARVAIDLSVERWQQAIDQAQPVVLAFEDGDFSRPIVMGLVAPLGELPVQREPGPTTFEVEASVDGARVRLTAREEVVLQCGEASISLKRNGRVVIRGTYVETCAATTNRIKGGNVRIN